MSVTDFLPRRRTIRHQGRLFTVRAPTYATVCRFLELYGEEVVALAALHKSQPNRLNHDAATALFEPSITLRQPRALAVLETCVESAELLTEWPIPELVAAILEICDTSKIVASLDIARLASFADSKRPPEVPDDPSDQELTIVKLAMDFGCSPCVIADLPHEAFTAALKCIEVLRARAPEQGPTTPQPRGKLDDLLNQPGFLRVNPRVKPEG